MADTDDTARRLDEIRDREQWASPGPWSLSRIAAHDSDGEYCGTDNYLIDANREEIGGLDLDDDAEFAAHARDDIPYLLDLVAARDKEIAELQGLLADLCEDSRAAAAAVRYRRALERLATIPPFGGRGDDWDELCPEVRRIANEALKGEPP